MPLIDAHQHFWDPAAIAYPWMDLAEAVIHRRYGPEHLAPHLERHGIDGTVLVQSADSDEDTDAMFAVAANPRVCAKVSGLYPAPGTDLRPWVGAAVELFGPERLMLGSDWPIAERAGGFDPVWSALVEVVDGFGPEVAEQLRSATARRFYRLTAPTAPSGEVL